MIVLSNANNPGQVVGHTQEPTNVPPIGLQAFRIPSADRHRAILEVDGTPFHPHVTGGDLICVDFTTNKLFCDGLYLVIFPGATGEFIAMRRFQRVPGEWWMSEENTNRPFIALKPEDHDAMKVVGRVIEIYKKDNGRQQ